MSTVFNTWVELSEGISEESLEFLKLALADKLIVLDKEIEVTPNVYCQKLDGYSRGIGTRIEVQYTLDSSDTWFHLAYKRCIERIWSAITQNRLELDLIHGLHSSTMYLHNNNDHTNYQAMDYFKGK